MTPFFVQKLDYELANCVFEKILDFAKMFADETMCFHVVDDYQLPQTTWINVDGLSLTCIRANRQKRILVQKNNFFNQISLRKRDISWFSCSFFMSVECFELQKEPKILWHCVLMKRTSAFHSQFNWGKNATYWVKNTDSRNLVLLCVLKHKNKQFSICDFKRTVTVRNLKVHCPQFKNTLSAI